MVAFMDLDPWMNDVWLEPREDLEGVTNMRTSLSANDATILSQGLVKNVNLFTSTAFNMLG